MKITDVRAYVVRAIESRPWLFVEVDTDQGITGIGESTNVGGGGAIVVAQTYNLLKHDLIGQDFSDGLIGQDPSDIDRIWHQLYRRFGTLGSRGFATTLISGIDMALWDIKGQATGRPVYDLLGGAVRDAVPLYSHCGPADDIDACVADAKAQVALGYEALKLDPFAPEMGRKHRRYIDGKISAAGAAHAEDLIATLRSGLGPDIEIMIDAHGNFDVSTATNLCNRMMPYDLTWFEEPLQPESLEAHRQLRRNTDINLCIGERKFTRWDFLPYLTEGLVNYIMPDICWTGGISEMKRIAILAETFLHPHQPSRRVGFAQCADRRACADEHAEHLPTGDEPSRRPCLQRLSKRAAGHPGWTDSCARPAWAGLQLGPRLRGIALGQAVGAGYRGAEVGGAAVHGA